MREGREIGRWAGVKGHREHWRESLWQFYPVAYRIHILDQNSPPPHHTHTGHTDPTCV